MKKCICTLAAILATAMLLCCCSLATGTRSVDYGCSCGRTSSYAYTESDEVCSDINVSFSGWVWRANGQDLDIGNSHYNAGTYARCSDYYSYALQGEIDSSHYADGFSAEDHDEFGLNK